MLRKIIFAFVLIFFFTPCTLAQNDINNTLEEQFKISGAEKLMDAVPKEATDSLDSLGVHQGDFNDIAKLILQKFLM